MLWAVVISVAIGALLGFWLKWPAIVVASGIAVAACTVVLPLSHWSFLGAVLFGFVLSSALQVGYLAGLLLRYARVRAGSWAGLLRSVGGAKQSATARRRPFEVDPKRRNLDRS